MAQQAALKPSLNLWQVTVSGVGMVIGAGIYVLIGAASAEAGNAVWLAFAIAAFMSMLTALSYVELASMFSSAAGEYEFTRQAFNEFLGFLAGWAMLVAYVIAAGAVSIGFAHYAGHFVEVDTRVAAVGLLLVLTAVVASGIERSIWLSAVLVVLQIGGLVLIVIAGAPHVGQRDLLEGASVTGVLSGAALVFFAFIGFDDMITLSEETKNPRRNIPLALLLALGISTVLYVLVGIAAVSVIGGEALAASDRPLALVIAHDWGGSAGDIVAFIALASTTNTTLIILTAASRIVYGMAVRGSLPSQLASLGSHRRVPYLAALLVLAVAIGFAVSGNIEIVASATDLAVYVVFILVNLSVIALRTRKPEIKRGFRAPFAIGRIPVTPILGLATIVTLMAFLDLEAWVIGAAALICGCLVWFAMTRARTDRVTAPH